MYHHWGTNCNIKDSDLRPFSSLVVSYLLLFLFLVVSSPCCFHLLLFHFWTCFSIRTTISFDMYIYPQTSVLFASSNINLVFSLPLTSSQTPQLYNSKIRDQQSRRAQLTSWSQVLLTLNPLTSGILDTFCLWTWQLHPTLEDLRWLRNILGQLSVTLRLHST